MTEPRTAITVTARPDGVDLDVTPYLRTTLRDLIGLLAEDPDVWDDLVDALTPLAKPHDRHLPDVGSRDDALIERLLGLLPTTVRLQRDATARLGRQLTAVADEQAPRGVAA